MGEGGSATLTPMHLRKAKLMVFWVRYPSSAIIKMYFPDIKFNKNNWRDDTVPDDQIDRQQLDFKVEHKVRSSSFEVESPTLKAIKRHLTHD